MNLLISLCLSILFIARPAYSDNCGIEKACCETKSLNTVLDTAYIVSSTLQELIMTVKSNAGDLSNAICRQSLDWRTNECPCNRSAFLKESKTDFYSDCSALQRSGKITESGIYKIWPKFYNEPFEIYCDLTTEGGGWSVFQRRGQYSTIPVVDFYRNWDDYKNGFGNLSEEFWLGNDKIFALTNSRLVTLRIDLEDFEGAKRYASFETFVIDGEAQKYKMRISDLKGDAGDSFLKHNNFAFSTKDSPNNKCPNLFKGGWWYGDCHTANLNGLNLKGKHDSFADGINYHSFHEYHYSLKSSEMKLRIKGF